MLWNPIANAYKDHAACTSLRENRDDRWEQTDGSLFSRKVVVRRVAPTLDQLTNKMDYAGRLHGRLWCVLKIGNEDHYAFEESFGYSDNQNPNAYTMNSRSFSVSPHDTNTPNSEKKIEHFSSRCERLGNPKGDEGRLVYNSMVERSNNILCKDGKRASYIHLESKENMAPHRREHEPVHCAALRRGHGARPRRVIANTMGMA